MNIWGTGGTGFNRQRSQVANLRHRTWSIEEHRMTTTQGVISTPTMTTEAVQPPGARSLRANFSWTFVGNVIYAACQWAMLVVLAKLGSPEIVGQFALGLAITAPVIMLTNLQLRAVQATDAKRAYSFGDYLGLRLAVTPLALLAHCRDHRSPPGMAGRHRSSFSLSGWRRSSSRSVMSSTGSCSSTSGWTASRSR